MSGSSTPAEPGVRAAEDWFVAHGLPYFVDGVRARVAAGLTPGRLRLVGVGAVVLGLAAGLAVGWWLGPAAGVAAGLTGALALAALYAARTLRVWLILTWAVRRTLGSLGLLVPLVTRALPLLMLFITFLFINAEVWQVASTLAGGVMWAAVLLFAGVAVGFLLTRLPEEVDRVDDGVGLADVRRMCAGTPLAAAAEALGDDDARVDAEVTGLQRANLVLVLLVAQAVQVLLLSLAVFAFYLVFGVVAVHDDVIASWVGEEPHPLLGGIVSRELVRVSVFLAAFSGLYFTVTAVTDDLYRRQFFSSVTDELERAVGARVAYRSLRDPGPPR